MSAFALSLYMECGRMWLFPSHPLNGIIGALLPPFECHLRTTSLSEFLYSLPSCPRLSFVFPVRHRRLAIAPPNGAARFH